MATIKFPNEMAPATSIGGNDKLMISKDGTGEAYQATFNQAKNYLELTGTELIPIASGLLPTPLAGQIRTMDVVGPGTWTHPTLTGGASLLAGQTGKFFFSGGVWSLRNVQNVKGDAGGTLSQLFNPAKVGGYAVDEVVRDAEYVEYVSLSNINTSALSDVSKWKPVGAKDYIEIQKFKSLPKSYELDEGFVNNDKGWASNQVPATLFTIEGGSLKINFVSGRSEAVSLPVNSLMANIEAKVEVRIKSNGLLKRVNIGTSYGSVSNSAFYNIADLTTEYKTYNFTITPIIGANGKILIGAFNSFNVGGEIEVDYIKIGDAPYGEYKLEAMQELWKLSEFANSNKLSTSILNWQNLRIANNEYVKKYDYSLGRLVSQLNFIDFGYFDLTAVKRLIVSKMLISSGGTLNIQLLKNDLSVIHTIPKTSTIGDYSEIIMSDYPEAKYLRMYYDSRHKAEDFVLAFSYDRKSFQIAADRKSYQIAASVQEDTFLKHQGYTVEYLDFNDLPLDGYRTITNGVWNSSIAYKSSNILPLPDDWESIIWDATNSTTVGIVFFDTELTHLTGAAGVSGTIQTQVEISRNDNKFRSAKYWQVSVGINTSRRPYIKLLRKPILNRVSSLNKTNLILNAKVFNKNLISLQEWNSNNPSKRIESEIVFNNPQEKPNRTAWRIPTACLTNAGTSLISCELRQTSDDKDAMDLYIKRKAVGASTWGEVLIYLNSSTYGRAMNPSFIVDKLGVSGVVGRIYLYYFTAKNNSLWATGNTRADLDMFEIYSDNDGLTWSLPISLKGFWKTEAEGIRAQVTSPGNGIQTKDGTFVLPIMNVITLGAWRVGYAYKKVGQQWQFTDFITRYATDNECCIWEMPNGKILLNVRVDTAPNGRRHVYNLNLDTGAIDIDESDETFEAKHNCQMGACTINYGGVKFYAMTFPDSISRKNNTLFISRDLKSWARVIVLSFGESWGYTSIDYNNNKLIYAAEIGSGALQGKEIVYHDLSNLLPKCVDILSDVFPLNINETLNKDYYAVKGWAY